MDTLHDRAPRGNNFRIIPLARPRIERAVDCDGWYVIRDAHGWLLGDRRQALSEFAELVHIEQTGRGRR
jgi:hypothetical protein